MKTILITGATGNVGFEVIRFLSHRKSEHSIIAGARNTEKAKAKFNFFPDLQFVTFDLENAGTFDRTFKNIETIFLIRPPHISDVEKYFRPLLYSAKEKGVSEVKNKQTNKDERFSVKKKKEAQKPPSQMLTPKHTIWEELPYLEQR